MSREQQLEQHLRRVLGLFAEKGWPRIKVFLSGIGYTTGSLDDEPADAIRAARRFLSGEVCESPPVPSRPVDNVESAAGEAQQHGD